MNQFFKKCLNLLFLTCFFVSSLNIVVFPMSPKRDRSGEASGSGSPHTPTRPPQKQPKISPAGHGLKSPAAGPWKTPPPAMPPSATRIHEKSKIKRARARSGGVSGAGSSSAGIDDLLTLNIDIISDLNTLFFDIESYQEDFFDTEFFHLLLRINSLVNNYETMSGEETVCGIIDLYIRLVNINRCLLYGNEIKNEEFYKKRFEVRNNLNGFVERLFNQLPGRINYLLSNGGVHGLLLQKIYSNVCELRSFLLLGYSVPGFEFTLYANDFNEFLKIIKKIENFLLDASLLYPADRFFERTFTLDDEHIGYVKNNTNAYPSGGHHVHNNAYPLLGPVVRQGEVVNCLPAKMREDATGVSCVRWGISPSGAVKDSTLFPECYNRMFLMYMQRLYEAAFGNVSPAGFVNIGSGCNEHGTEGSILIKHAHKTFLAHIDACDFDTCGLSTERCLLDRSPQPLIINIAWRKEFIDPSGVGSYDPSHFVVVLCSAYPIMWEPYGNVSHDEFKRVLDIWLGDQDALSLWCEMKLNTLNHGFIESLRKDVIQAQGGRPAVNAKKREIASTFAEAGRAVAFKRLARAQLFLEKGVDFNAFISDPVVQNNISRLCIKNCLKNNTYKLTFVKDAAGGHHTQINILKTGAGQVTGETFFELNWLDALQEVLNVSQGASGGAPVIPSIYSAHPGNQGDVMVLDDSSRFIAIGDMRILIPRGELENILSRLPTN